METTTKVRIAKASENDLRALFSFLEAYEYVYEGNSLEYICDTDPIRIVYEAVKCEFGCELFPQISQRDMLNHEVLKRMFHDCFGRWMKVINTAVVLIDQVCDNEMGYIALHPYIERSINNQMLGE